jgi:hypothetical protein
MSQPLWCYLPTDGPTVATGIPGTGKTVQLTRCHDYSHEYSIFFNWKHRDYSRSPRVNKIDDDAVEMFKRCGKLTVETNDTKEIEKWIDWIEKQWDGDGHFRKKAGPLRVYFDETDILADRYARGDNNRIVDCFTKQRNAGILPVAIIQLHSGQTAAAIRKSAHARIVFRLDPGEFGDYAHDYGFIYNPPLNPKAFSPFQVYINGKVYHCSVDNEIEEGGFPTDPNVPNVPAVPVEPEEPDDDDDDDDEDDEEPEVKPDVVPLTQPGPAGAVPAAPAGQKSAP